MNTLTPDQKSKVVRVLAKQPTAVLATTDNASHPAAAVVLFAATDDLEIIFGSHPTRKYKNLKANGNAAMAFLQEEWSVERRAAKADHDLRQTQTASMTTKKEVWSIQCHGTVTELSSPKDQDYINTFMAKHPEATAQLLAGTVFFKMNLSWIRYIHLGHKPEEFEVRLSDQDWH